MKLQAKLSEARRATSCKSQLKTYFVSVTVNIILILKKVISDLISYTHRIKYYVGMLKIHLSFHLLIMILNEITYIVNWLLQVSILDAF